MKREQLKDFQADESADPGVEGIAIVGLAGRFPGAADVDELWRNLVAGVEALTHFEAEELLAAGVSTETLADPHYVRARGVLAGADLFDAPFFGFSPREAELTDPQQRVFLECAWAALEHAGHAPAAAGGPGNRRVGVYAGAITSTYLIYNLLTNAASFSPLESWQIGIGNEKDALATRVSYKFDLTGPSITVQTACSSSLVAVHLACQALLSYQCDLALAGGVSIRFPQEAGYLHHPQGILSPDGHCRPFDHRAAGTVFGAGAGAVVLKRLEEALADGDTVWAVIRATAVNNDGSRKVGFTAPGVEGQAAVIAEAQTLAEVSPETIGFVETHGTGTDLGDLIEVEALRRVFRAATPKKGFCALGAVKSQVGHLDNASGICGLIKTVLALARGLIPPTLHFEVPNPKLGLPESPFFVNSEVLPWPRGETPRRAGVSSFGIGGTNAHAVLEEAPPPAPSSPSRPWQLLLLSARTPEALKAVGEALTRHLETHPEEEFADVAWTLAAGRRRLSHRSSLVCRDRQEALAALVRPLPMVVGERQERPVAFLFPGQGAQHPGMLAGLFATSPAFRHHLEGSARLLRRHLGQDLPDLLFATGVGAAERLADTAVAQPALLAVELALAELWGQWGVEPEAMLGHSLGEYAAATLAGVFSTADALELVAVRGRLMGSLPPGAMLALPLSEEEALGALGEQGDEGLVLAAINGPERVVVSGPFEAVDTLAERLLTRGVHGRRLVTSHAFHSPMIEPILEAFGEAVAKVAPGVPARPFLSNVSGTWITPEEAADPAYWVRQIRSPVRFAQGLRELVLGELVQGERVREGDRALLEVGPGQTLSALARRCPDLRPGQPVVASGRSAKEVTEGGEDKIEEDRSRLLAAAGELWRAGVRLEAPGLFAGETRRRIPLPTYPFERRRYWMEPGLGEAMAPGRATVPGRATAAGQSQPLAPDGVGIYLPSWHRGRGPRGRPPRRREVGGSCWWMLMPDEEEGGLAEEMESLLNQAGATVVRIRFRDFFGSVGEGFALRPGHEEDFEALAGALEGRGVLPDHVIHLWSLGRDSGTEDEPDTTFDTEQRRGFESLLHAVQALGRHRASGGNSDLSRVLVVARGVARVLGGESVVAGRAALSALARVIPGEIPGAACRLVDVGGEIPDPGVLLAEALSLAPSPEQPTLVAFRGGERWVEAWERAGDAEKEGGGNDGPGLLRDGGAYLVTAGRGGIGLELARHLLTEHQARLALVLPPEGELSAGEELAGEEGWRELEVAGATVIRADAGNGEAFAKALARAEAVLGPLDGVIHGVGAGEGPGEEREESVAEAMARFAALVRGALHLRRLMASGRQAGFVLFCAPRAGVVGGKGKLPAAVAGAVLDALAQGASRPERGEGFGAISTLFLSLDGLAEIDGVPAGELMERVLAAPLGAQVLVSPREPEALRREAFSPPTARPRDPWSVGAPGGKKSGRAGTAHPRPPLATPYAPPSTPVEEGLAAAWGEALGLTEVGVNDHFFDLGGDSLLALQLAGRLSQLYPVEIGPKDLFDHSTVEALAAVLEERLLARIEELPEEEVERLMAALGPGP